MELSADAFDAALTPDPVPVVVPPVVENFDDETGTTDVTPDAKAAPARDDAGKFVKSDEKPGDEKPEKVAKPRNDPQARIDQAIARQREAERRAEDAQRRADEAERRASEKAAAPKVDVKPEKFPTYADYLVTHENASLEDYMDARDDWKEQQRESKARTERETETVERTFTAKASAFSEQYAKAVEADAELPKRLDARLLQVRPYSLLTAADKAAIRNIADPRERDAIAFRSFLADHWIESPHAMALIEHLSDPATFQRLATLPPAQVVRDLARIEAGFTAASDKESSGPAREAIPASKAHPPIKPLGTAPRVPDDEGSEDEPVDAFIRRENAKDRKAGRL